MSQKARAHKAKERFLHIWFSDGTDPDSELGKELKRQLMDLSSKRLFENVRAKAKSKNERIKAKAEILLKGLKEGLMPRRNAALKGHRYERVSQF